MERKITCGELIKQIDDGMKKQINSDLKKYDLTFSQMSVLAILNSEETKSLTMKEIEQKLRVAQPTVAGIVKRLKEKDFIQVRVVQGDGRMKVVTLTEKGKACCQASKEDIMNTEERLLSGFSTGERRLLFTMLTILRDELKGKKKQG